MRFSLKRAILPQRDGTIRGAHDGSSEYRSDRLLDRPARRALVRAHVSRRLRRRLVARHAAHRQRHGADHARAIRRLAISGRARRDPRRAPGLRALLQARLLLAAPARDIRRVAGRHVVSRRAARRDARDGVRRLAPPCRLPAAHGLRRAADAAWPRCRTAGQLHQRRTVGPSDRLAMGYGVPQRGRRAAASVAALRVCAGGRHAFHHPVVVLLQAASAGPSIGTVPPRLRRAALHRGVRTGARRLSRLPRARHDHGPVAVRADDPRRHRAARMESALDPVLGAAFPVFALVGCGVLAGRFRLITPGSSEALNRFVYAFALPALLFVAVYRGSLAELLGSGAFLLGVILATFLTTLTAFALSRYLWHAS